MFSGYPLDYAPAKSRDKMYDSILAALQASEEKILRHMTPGHDASITLGLRIPVTVGDVSFLVEEIFKGRSAITGLGARLLLVRWRKPTSSTLIKIGEASKEQKSSNVNLGELVCMTKEEATRHEKEVLRGNSKVEDLYDAATIEKIEALRKEAAKYEKYR
jgi:hypothetical protein